MSNTTYQIIELVGTSELSIEEAINAAIAKSAKLHGKLDWYEIMETRGLIEGDKSKAYQVHLKIGCPLH